MAENPEKQTAWKCRLDQYPPMILNPRKQSSGNNLSYAISDMSLKKRN